MLVNIIGGSKAQKKHARGMVEFCVKMLMPRMRTLDITVRLCKPQGAMGYCLETDNDRTFEIELDKTQSMRNLLETLAHEMVHVKQYSRKELKEDFPRTLWFNKEYNDGRCYPWEREAWDMQSILAHKYIKQHKLGTIKVLKSLDKRS